MNVLVTLLVPCMYTEQKSGHASLKKWHNLFAIGELFGQCSGYAESEARVSDVKNSVLPSIDHVVTFKYMRQHEGDCVFKQSGMICCIYSVTIP